MIQGHIKERAILEGFISRDSSSIVLSGKEGTGKKLVALSFLKEVLKADNLKEIRNHPDLFIIENEENMIKADEIREVIEFSKVKSYLGGKKAVLIDNAENMNRNAQNALLKILEEPPMGEFIILITSDFESLLPTIRSRVTNISFGELTNEDLKKIFPDITPEILAIADGSAKKADRFFHGDINLMNGFAKSYIMTQGDYFLGGKEISYVNFLIYSEYTEKVLLDMINTLAGEKPKLKLTEKLLRNASFSVEYLIEKAKKLDKNIKLYGENYNKNLILTDLFFGN